MSGGLGRLTEEHAPDLAEVVKRLPAGSVIAQFLASALAHLERGQAVEFIRLDGRCDQCGMPPGECVDDGGRQWGDCYGKERHGQGRRA